MLECINIDELHSLLSEFAIGLQPKSGMFLSMLYNYVLMNNYSGDLKCTTIYSCAKIGVLYCK